MVKKLINNYLYKIIMLLGYMCLVLGAMYTVLNTNAIGNIALIILGLLCVYIGKTK